MKLLKHVLSICLLLLCILAKAQVTTNFNNETLISSKGQFVKDYKTQIDFEIPSKNIADLLEIEKRELAISNETKPFRLAAPVSVDLDIAKLTNWTYDKQYAYGKFTVKLNGALSASINFDKFYLPKATELYVYNENGNMITGPVTEKENNANNIWGSWVYRGQFVTIEIKTPVSTKEQLLLHSSNIAYGYKEVYKSVKVGGFGQSGACNINVICPLGNGWELERNSVSTILSATGGEFCTGSLIMNACGTNTPYYLTANHCFDGNASGWRFSFQAWSTTCPNPGVNTNGVMYNGSTLRARNAASDFCLVELNTTPPVTSGIHYAGWSRSTVPATNGVGIHHPRGDVMKISSYTTPLIRADNPNLCGIVPISGLSWVVNWNQGVTEGGSSGSPLFDQNHRVVGQLGGGPSSCTAAAGCRSDGYGRFDNSWTGGGTNATRLSNWLDPSNSGAMTTNTTNVSNLNPPLQLPLFVTGADNFCGSTSSYSLNVPTGTNVSWQSSNPNIATVTPNGNPTTVTKILDGVVTITATVTSCGPTLSATKEIIIGAPQIEMISFSNAVGGQGYWCSSHTNNLFSVEPTYLQSANFEARLLNYPSMTVFRTNSNANTATDPFGYVPSGWYIIQLRTTNSCGTSQWYETEVEYVNCLEYGGGCPDCPFRVTASPNPAEGDLTVVIDKEKAAVKSLPINERIRYDLYDLTRTHLVRQWTFDNGQSKQTLNIRGIATGQYVLVVTKGKYRQSTQILIK